MAGGTAGCADFREGGRKGVTALREAAEGLAFRPCIFGREGGEEIADGLGISSTRDIPDTDTLVAKAKRAGKKIALHAGERDAADVDAALTLDPDLLIHCTCATKKQLRECADRQFSDCHLSPFQLDTWRYVIGTSPSCTAHAGPGVQTTPRYRQCDVCTSGHVF